ncbi:MAG: alpha amylase C-terminal domain-containing protein, partial [Bacteroidales bacterium]
DLSVLIRKSHQMGLLVIMDLVHAHFVENTNEGLYALDGSPDLYNYPEPKGTHPYWGSKMFHFGRNQVRRFLLSNLRYWVEEFHLDGFRFDGVSAMIYFHRGYVDVFGTYENYFGNQVDEDALIYLSLANDLIHEITGSKHLSIAEEVSGMPGMTVPTFEGGTGFDYRLSMGIPDFWIRWIKERQDEDWVMRDLWEVMNHRMSNVPQITYCESHDQALVGDQTLAFRLMGSAMYTAMDIHSQNPIIDRGLALHKMIRLFTLSLGGGYGGYLNFMGNEFGHPEWIDFPRKDNQWSYKYARRQWSLLDNSQLKYQYLYAFDKAMIDFATKLNLKTLGFARERQIHEENKTIVFDLWNGLYVLVFNWHVNQSVPDYHIPVAKAGKYISVLNSDDKKFGGFGRVDNGGKYFTFSKEPNAPYLSIYNINRAVQVFQWIEE